jgi:hypothetical protein
VRRPRRRQAHRTIDRAARARPSAWIRHSWLGAGRACPERGTRPKPPVSGLETVRVFASANGGRYRRITKTTKKKIRFVGKPGRRYRFYSVAVDKAGNQEPAPATPDAKARLKKTR